MDLSKKNGNQLVQLAYLTICEQLDKKNHTIDIKSLISSLSDPVFTKKTGTFVTLKKNGSLRGCIGNIISDKTIVDGVRVNAINAAFNDYRFQPLKIEELDSLEIDVSVLTQPEKKQYSGWQELSKSLRVNVDGIILRKGSASATFLPQVWEQIPRVEDFLSQLCLKAGLESNSWQSNRLEIETYQVQSFSELF